MVLHRPNVLLGNRLVILRQRLSRRPSLPTTAVKTRCNVSNLEIYSPVWNFLCFKKGKEFTKKQCGYADHSGQPDGLGCSEVTVAADSSSLLFAVSVKNLKERDEQTPRGTKHCNRG